MSSTHHVAQINGQPLHYWSYGSPSATKPAVIAIHGFTGSHQGFYKIVPYLEKEYHVIAPDLPGFGESAANMPKLAIEDHASSIVAFITSLALPEPPVLLGHSYGTLVVSKIHQLAPYLSDHKTILVSPIPSPVRLLDRRLVGKVLGQLHYEFGARTGAVGTWWLKRRLTSRVITRTLIMSKDPTLRKEIYNEHFNNLEYLNNPYHYLALYKELNRNGIVAYARSVDKETLIITGGKDQAAPLSEQRKAAQLFTDATLEIIPNAGHLAHYEHPRKIARAIMAFLEK